MNNLNVIYNNGNIRVFKLINGEYYVEGIKNRTFKKLTTAIKKANELGLHIELSNLFNYE